MKKIAIILSKQPLITLGLFFLALSSLLFLANDPDFFWHLKYGEYIFKGDILGTDIFTYTFSNYKFVDYEWLGNAILFALYKLGNYLLPAVFFALIVILIVFLLSKIKLADNKNKQWSLAINLLAVFLLNFICGIRIQTFTVLGSALFYLILFKFVKTDSKAILFLPIIMLFWVNTHPGFIIGIALILIFIFSLFLEDLINFIRHSGKNEKNQNLRKNTKLILILIPTTLATLITPFGHRILFQTINFALYRYPLDYISEWLAPNFHQAFGAVVILSIIIGVYALTRRKRIEIFEIILIIFFGLLTFNSVRNYALFVVVALPTFQALAKPDFIKFFNDQKLIFIINKFLFLAIMLTILVIRIETFFKCNTDKSYLFTYQYYVPGAVEYMKNNPYEGNLLNSFNYGGYLIWFYPEKKLFIDGRMPCWQDEFGKPALEYKQDVADLESPKWRDYLDKYNVEVVLESPNTPIINALRTDPGWEVRYEDEKSVVIYRR